MKKKKCDWIIEYVANGFRCKHTGKVQNPFPPYMCDAHTHGICNYGHMEFQLVLAYEANEVMRLLNTLGMRVAEGEHFKGGDLVEGLYLDCPILLREFTDIEGKTVLRLIVSDKFNRWPKEADPPHCFQLLQTELLYQCNGHGGKQPIS